MLRHHRSALVAVVLLGAVALTGCGAAGEANPEKIGPRGVDGMVIPTPEPDPDDFVAAVDNPWFPLAVGTVWTYDVSGSRPGRLEVRVQDDRKVIAGVSCTVVLRRTLDQKGTAVGEESYYAQDVSGNVWLFGQSASSGTGGHSWQAGVDGAQAGVAMLAHPRVGDGYEQESAPGIAEDRSTILSVDDERTVPAGKFTGVVVTEDTSPLGPTDVVQRAYAPGTGLVEATAMVGGTDRMVLVEVSGP